MLSKFIFIMSIITNEGDLQMKAYDVEKCPDVQSFGSEMEKLRKEGQFINWNALCLERGVKGESINHD